MAASPQNVSQGGSPVILDTVAANKLGKSPELQRIANALLIVALAAATLWDYRLFDVRVFDGVALLCLVGWLALAPESRSGFLSRRRRYWLLFSTMVVYALLGYALHGHRSSLAILALATIGFLLIGRRDWLRAIGPSLWILVGIHVAFFLVQFVVFYGFRYEIDYQTVLGNASRIMLSPNHMRAAGLFQEPNSYCLNIFILGTIVALQRSNPILILAAACTMAISESIWGVSAAFMLLLLYAICRFRSPRQMIVGLVTLSIATAAVFNAYLWLTKQPEESLPFFYTRALNVPSDPSTLARYMRTTCSAVGKVESADIPQTVRSLQWIFGEGLSTHFFTECLSANGIAFLVKSLGGVGLLALLAGFFRALQGLPASAKIHAFLAIGFSFTTYPVVTYLIFWIWLAAIFGLLRQRNSAPDALGLGTAAPV